MHLKGPLLPESGRVTLVTADDPQPSGSQTLATRDHRVIKRWATQRQAEPATGEETESGPSTVQVRDGGAGIRFNFPGTSAYRAITWNEWLDHFERHRLTFVFEELTEDGNASARYRLVKADDWPGTFR